MADVKDKPDSSTTSKNISPSLTRHEGPPSLDEAEVHGEQQFKTPDSNKIGVTGAVFLILNKMIGTGSK